MTNGQSARTKALLKNLTGNRQDVVKFFAPAQVAIHLSPTVISNPQAQMMFSFAINIAARLHPVIQHLQVIITNKNTPLTFQPPRWPDKTLFGHISCFLRSLDPPLRWTVDDKPTLQPNSTLYVGPGTCAEEHVVFIGSHGWQAVVSPSAPVAIGSQVNPIGAYATACLGVAEVWKRLLYPHRALFPTIPIFPLEQELHFSTFSYRTGLSEPNPPLPIGIDVGHLTMVGLGAGGGATAFTLASLLELKGQLNLIEPDEIDVSNLNRYVYADSSDAGSSRVKTEVIKSCFGRFSNLTIQTFTQPYRDATTRLAPEDYRHVVAAVHSRKARRDIQYETPNVLWDAGATEDGEFRIWRMILGRTECMWCKHPPGEKDPEEQQAAQLSQALGIHPQRWLQLLQDNGTFTSGDVAEVSKFLGANKVTFDLPQVGQRFGDWEVEQCGRLLLPELDAGIPIPFAPVMAGVLLAGEVIKECYYPEAVLDSCYWNTLLGRFMLRNRPYRRTPRNECTFCHDEVYIAQYQRRWGIAP